jgi:hypothetical protein
MKKIAYVRVVLDEEVSEYIGGAIRCGSVISEDENGDIIKDHQEFINNNDYKSKGELIACIALDLGVDKSNVEIAQFFVF